MFRGSRQILKHPGANFRFVGRREGRELDIHSGIAVHYSAVFRKAGS